MAEIGDWNIEKINSLYEGVLRRTPTPTEAESLAKELNRTGNLGDALKNMLSSHEFGVMMLPDLVNEHIARPQKQPIFFLHIPKTAGTSFRLSLSDAFGVPPFLLYRHTSWQGYGLDEQMKFWPFWVGHAGISAFPESHRGVTVFREARSRILSQYRQREEENHRRVPRKARSNDESADESSAYYASAEGPFSEWVPKMQSAINWLIPAPIDAECRTWNGLITQHQLKALSDRDLRKQLKRGIKRIIAAAWSHDLAGMTEVVRKVTGVNEPRIYQNENQFKHVPTTKPTFITKDDLIELERISKQEQVMIKIAVEAGLISPIDSDFAQEQFEKTAERLEFKFA